jgi:hypothetical protein
MSAPGGRKRPGGSLSADDRPNASSVASGAQARVKPRFRRLTEHLWRLGARPVGEMLLEVANGRDLIDALEAYARIDARTVIIVGAATGGRCR